MSGRNRFLNWVAVGDGVIVLVGVRVAVGVSVGGPLRTAAIV